MAHHHDYIPKKDADFDGWLANLVKYVQEKMSQWDHIPAGRFTELDETFSQWRLVYEKMTGPHTGVDTEAKHEARDKADKISRNFVQQFLKFTPVTNEDRRAMNIPNPDTTKTPIHRPSSRPVIGELVNLGGFRVEIPFFDETTPNSRAKPYGCNGCLLSFYAGTEKITDYTELNQTRLMTHSPYTLDFEPSVEGKFLFCACRWQSETGELGPWSELHHIVVS